jgi:hypothetical protein
LRDRVLIAENRWCRFLRFDPCHRLLNRGAAAAPGVDRSCQAQMMLVQRASLLAVLCGHTEAAIMLGRPVSVDDYLQMTSTLRRLLTTLSPSFC